MEGDKHKELEQIQNTQTIKPYRSNHQQGARDKAGSTDAPASNPIEFALRQPRGHPRNKGVKNTKRKPNHQQPHKRGDRRDGGDDRLPRAPTRLKVGPVEVESPASRIRHAPIAKNG